MFAGARGRGPDGTEAAGAGRGGARAVQPARPRGFSLLPTVQMRTPSAWRRTQLAGGAVIPAQTPARPQPELDPCLRRGDGSDPGGGRPGPGGWGQRLPLQSAEGLFSLRGVDRRATGWKGTCPALVVMADRGHPQGPVGGTCEDRSSSPYEKPSGDSQRDLGCLGGLLRFCYMGGAGNQRESFIRSRGHWGAWGSPRTLGAELRGQRGAGWVVPLGARSWLSFQPGLPPGSHVAPGSRPVSRLYSGLVRPSAPWGCLEAARDNRLAVASAPGPGGQISSGPPAGNVSPPPASSAEVSPCNYLSGHRPHWHSWQFYESGRLVP